MHEKAGGGHQLLHGGPGLVLVLSRDVSPEGGLALECLIAVGHMASVWLVLSQMVRESLLPVELLLALRAGVYLLLVFVVILPRSG